MPAETPPSINTDTGHPRAVLFCRPNSHPFTDRNLLLDQEVKVGRSIARAKPGPNNAIFDCKVLSRNHAVLWYSQGKFYLQDTKSSNGTFVNNQRLSKGTEESSPREVCSGDIVQFGVDVMENSRQVTHGCIIATLKLYLPDGKEAKASQSIVNTTAGACIPPQDLYQLNTFIQESIAREQLLENKLIALQSIISDTELSSKSSWKALMEEDRLLTRVEILENQLGTYSKSMTEEKLREEAKRLMEDKEKYQVAAKDNLKNLVDEKLEVVRKLQDTDTKFSSLQQEYNSIHSLYNSVLQENSKLSVKISDLTDELGKICATNKENNIDNIDPGDSNDLINNKEIIIENRLADIHTYAQNGDSGLVNGNGGVEDGDDSLLNMTETTQQDIQMGEDKDSTEMEEEEEEGEGDEDTDEIRRETQPDNGEVKQVAQDDLRSKSRLKELENELLDAKESLTEYRNDNSSLLQEMKNLKNKLDNAERLIQSQDSLVKEMEIRVKESSHSVSSSSTPKLQGEDTLTNTDDDNVSTTESISSQEDFSSSQDDLTLYEDNISSSTSSLSSDYSDATLKRSPSKNKLCPSCLGAGGSKKSSRGDLSPAADVMIESAAAAINDLTVDPALADTNDRIAELEKENYTLKQKLMELEEEKLVLKATEELDAQLASLESGSLSDLNESSSHLNESLDNNKQTSTASATEQESHSNDHENKDSLTDDNNESQQDTEKASVEDKIDGLEVSEMPVNKTDAEKDSTTLENKIDIIKQIPTDNDQSDHKTNDLSPSSLQLDESAVSGYNGGESLLNLSCSSCSEFSQVETALSEAEIKIAQLLKLRENLTRVQAENHDLEQSVSVLEEDIETLSATSRVLTIFNIFSVSVLFLAVFIAFLPSLSNLMGTRDL